MQGFLAFLCVVGHIAIYESRNAYAAAATTTHKGIAAYYSPGTMARVARNRGIELRDDVDGYASLTSCSHIGKVITASISGSRPERYQVLDCSHPRDRARHLRQGIVIEVDYQSAVRHGFTRRGHAPATVWLGD
jgi:hypothetical protein